ncbi:MAG: type II toxin-antitoxin system VapC family toxin [Candidatus Diapherotrites archaeon]|nr:type II toxin-antitoxin system VapC family toxin [Candidatus Diapherotrites archaeon]
MDSTIIIDYLRREKTAVETIGKLLSEGEILKTTLFNYYETYFGAIAFGKKEDEKETTLAFLNSIEIVQPTLVSIRKSAEIRLELQKKGQKIDPNDILIAGIIAIAQEPIYTKNTKHFSQVQELIVKNY